MDVSTGLLPFEGISGVTTPGAHRAVQRGCCWVCRTGSLHVGFLLLVVVVVVFAFTGDVWACVLRLVHGLTPSLSYGMTDSRRHGH